MSHDIVFLNGQYKDIQEASVSILDRGFNYGDGIFETMRVYNGRVFQLDSHLDRFFKSAESIFLKLPYSQESITEIIYEIINRNNHIEAIIKLTATRGVSEPGLGIQSSTSPTLLVHARQFKSLSKEHYDNGVGISLFPLSAVKLSGLSKPLKSCNYLSHIIIKKMADDQGSFEGVMLNEKGHVCEGTTTNIFIIKNDVLKTPPINEYVLEGITRKVIINIANNNNIVTQEENFHAEDIELADEVFLSNTGIEILPVGKIDNNKIKNTVPGPLTKTIHDQFLKFIDDESK